MISRATVHSTIVLMNRRMNAERGVSSFGPVCSNVAGMLLHHLEGTRAVQDEAVDSRAIRTDSFAGAGFAAGTRSLACFRVVISSFFLRPAMDSSAMNESAAQAIDRRPIATRNRKVGAGNNSVAGVTKSITECHFDRGHVRVCRGGLRARPDFC